MASRLRLFEDRVRSHKEQWTREFLPENKMGGYRRINPSTRVEGLHTIYPTGFENCYGPVTAAFPILLLS